MLLSQNNKAQIAISMPDPKLEYTMIYLKGNKYLVVFYEELYYYIKEILRIDRIESAEDEK